MQRRLAPNTIAAQDRFMGDSVQRAVEVSSSRSGAGSSCSQKRSVVIRSSGRDALRKPTERKSMFAAMPVLESAPDHSRVFTDHKTRDKCGGVSARTDCRR